MKYTGIYMGNSSKAQMYVSCKACKGKLDGDESFCPYCGRKLRRLEIHVDKSKILRLLGCDADKRARAKKGGEE